MHKSDFPIQLCPVSICIKILVTFLDMPWIAWPKSVLWNLPRKALAWRQPFTWVQYSLCFCTTQFASWSAFSLHLIPEWPGTQIRATLFSSAIWFSAFLHSHTRIEEISGFPAALIAAWLSEQMLKRLPATFSLISVSAQWIHSPVKKSRFENRWVEPSDHSRP